MKHAEVRKEIMSFIEHLRDTLARRDGPQATGNERESRYFKASSVSVDSGDIRQPLLSEGRMHDNFGRKGGSTKARPAHIAWEKSSPPHERVGWLFGQSRQKVTGSIEDPWISGNHPNPETWERRTLSRRY